MKKLGKWAIIAAVIIASAVLAGVAYTACPPPASTHADLLPTNIALSSSSVVAGSALAVNWSILNQGTAAANATSTTAVRITQSSTSSAGSNLASIATSALAAGANQAQNATLTAPTTPGTYYVWIVADANANVTNDNNVNNNSQHSAALTVTSVPIGQNTILPTAPVGFHWSQTFGDEFNTTFANKGTTSGPVTLDTSHWQIDHYCGAANLTAFQSPTYRCGNSISSDTVANGLLTMTIQTTAPASRNIIDTRYVSGNNTSGIQPLSSPFWQKYGYFVYNSKVPTCSSAEWDLEFFGSNQWNGGQYAEMGISVHSTCNAHNLILYQAWNGSPYQWQSYSVPDLGDITLAFHQYGFLWTDDGSTYGAITFYFDGVKKSGPFQLVSSGFGGGMFFDIYWDPCVGCEGSSVAPVPNGMQFEWIRAYQLVPN